MTQLEINKQIRSLTQIRNKMAPRDYSIVLDEFLEKLVDENGEIETQDIREKVLTNVVNWTIRNNKRLQYPFTKYGLEIAKIEERKGNLREAKEQLEVVLGDYSSKFDAWNKVSKEEKTFQPIFRESVFAQAVYRYNVIKYKLGEQSFDRTLEILNDILENDAENRLALGKKLSSFDLFKLECAEEVDFEYLEHEIFPLLDALAQQNGDGKISWKTKYSEDLSARNRLKFIKNNLDVKKIYMGKSEFAGYLLFELEDADLVVAERFWSTNKKGDIKGSEENATFILPKDESVELIKLSKSKVAERAKTDSRIQRLNHTSPRNNDGELAPFSSPYYKNFKEKFNKAIGYEYFSEKSSSQKVKPKKVEKRRYGKEKPAVEPEKDTKTDEKTIENKDKIDYDLLSKEELIELVKSHQALVRAANEQLLDAMRKKQETKKLEAELLRVTNLLSTSSNKIRERDEEK